MNLSARAIRALFMAACLPLFATPAAAQPSMFDSTVTQVATGGNHACALTTTGAVRCWGSNEYGQLGDNTVLQRATAIDVPGLSNVTALAAGAYHTCALVNGGGVKCWGYNSTGQLGDNALLDRHSPGDVVGAGGTGLLSNVVALVAGGYHNCVLTHAGGVKCWGNNGDGQLGNNASGVSPAPVDVTGLSSGVAAIAAGAFHACALTGGGGMKCWGDNAQGQLGDNATGDRHVPVDVSGLTSGVAGITAGVLHTCALTTAGGVKCWGWNANGQLGDGSNTDRHAPADVAGLGSGMAAVAAGYRFACALTTAGAVKCWGANAGGQLGDNSSTDRWAPVDVSGLASGIAAIAPGATHTCARTSGGGVMCWGQNYAGQLGDGTTAERLTAIDVARLASGVAFIQPGAEHTCAITSAGGAKCWGRGSFGQLGYKFGPGDFSVPIEVSGLESGVTAIGGGNRHSCALTSGGGAQCWGYNGSGQLGDGSFTQRDTPVNVMGLTSGVAAIAVGMDHGCALTTLGAVKCWGDNTNGQLGDNSANNSAFAVDVTGLGSGVIAIGAGLRHTCAIATDGGVKCWGLGTAGQLGDGTSTDRWTPVNVMGDATAISLGWYHTCALTNAGGVKCWGYNDFGQIGNNTLSPQPAPVDVSGLASGVSSLSLGSRHSCVVTTAGSAQCWGYNEGGQVGDGSTTDRLAPVDVSGLAGNVLSIAGGFMHTCALTTGGSAKCWGFNGSGRVGDDSTTNRLMPTAIRLAQSIAFTPPARLALGVATSLAASATSGLAIAFDTWTPATCTVAGNSVTANASGLCGLRASQAGTGNNAPAPKAMGLAMISSGPASADFDGDGRPDIIWSSTGSGATYVWYMGGTPPGLISDAFIAAIDPSWKIHGVADFNGDGRPDLVWRNTVSGDAYVWYMNGPTLITDAFLFNLPSEWSIQGVADFNADGHPDFLMRNTSTGVAFAWFFNGNVATGDQFLFAIDPSWKVEAVADLDRNGQPDLLFRSMSSGLAFAWRTQWNGTSLSMGASDAPSFSIDPVWEVVQLADWNGDGYPDLLFRNTSSGVVFVWYLNGTSLGANDYINQIDPSWEIVPHR